MNVSLRTSAHSTAKPQLLQKEIDMEINKIGGEVVDAAMKVHSVLGGRDFWNRFRKLAC